MDPPEDLSLNPEDESFDLVVPEQVNTWIQKAQEATGTDLSKVRVNYTRPGEEAFDRSELEYRLLVEHCNGDFAVFSERFADWFKLPLEEMKQKAQEIGINLQGTLPGFTRTRDGEGEITFFAVSKKNAIDMATSYAQKIGDNITFVSVEDAAAYLREVQAPVAIFHEIGHIVYQLLSDKDRKDLARQVLGDPILSARIRQLQADKYGGEENVPEEAISDEAFAEMIGPQLQETITGMPARSRI